MAESDLVVTTYGLVIRDIDALREMSWRRVVLDEAQAVKNAATRAAVAVRSLPSARRFAVTGTPVENRLGDLWSLMEFANPGLLGQPKSFKERFATPIERHGNAEAAARLRSLTQPFVLRRLKTDTSLEATDGALGDAARGLTGAEAGRPQWLDGLVQRELRAAAKAFWSRERFVRIRLLERLGLIALEPDDTYVLAMISAIGPNKADTLRADPELVEKALWRVFEVERGGEVSLTNVDRFGGEEWRNTFLELAADEMLGRARVLAQRLVALGRDFAAYRAGWFSATFIALMPTVHELSVLQPALRR